MFRYFLAMLAVVIATGDAHAAAYDDFANGLSAYARGDYPDAISSFTAALNADDLAPNLKPTAYLDRGRSYIRGGHCPQALNDLSAARRLDASNIEITESLAFAESCVGDFKDSDADFTSAIQAGTNPDFVWARGHERWDAGDFGGAATDFEATRALKPSYAYAVLWLVLAQMRMGSDAAALAHASDLDLGTWPGPIFRLFLGQIQPDAVNAAAAQGDADAIKNQQCEASFYVAEWWLNQKNSDTAKSLLKAAADTCPSNFIERGAAKMELNRLH